MWKEITILTKILQIWPWITKMCNLKGNSWFGEPKCMLGSKVAHFFGVFFLKLFFKILINQVLWEWKTCYGWRTLLLHLWDSYVVIRTWFHFGFLPSHLWCGINGLIWNRPLYNNRTGLIPQFTHSGVCSLKACTGDCGKSIFQRTHCDTIRFPRVPQNSNFSPYKNLHPEHSSCSTSSHFHSP